MRKKALLRPVTLGLLAIAIAGQLVLLSVRNTAGTVSGDEGTFLAMASSLALDGDLRFSESDRERLERADGRGRKAVILQQGGGGVGFSKPAVFALFAAPWYRVFGESGILWMNALFLGLAVALGARALQLRSGEEGVGPAVLTFVGTSVLLSYVAWTMSDSLQASLVLAGAALVLGVPKDAERRTTIDSFLGSLVAAAIGGAALGLAAAMRYPNLLLAVAPGIGLLASRRIRRGGLALAAVALAFAGALGLNQALTGAPVPYKAVRATFNEETGYPAGEGAEERLGQFETARATHSMGLVPALELRTSAHAAVYFFVGRHTGLLLYGPAALVFAWLILRRRDPVGVCLLLAAVGLAAFYILWMPRNYFGGATFLGNRYFLSAYALLMLAPVRLPGRRALTIIWMLGAAVFLSAVWSSTGARELDRSSQMHAYRGIFRLLPYESTAMDLDGRRDRYWSDELVRFVDPWAKVGRNGFKLFAGAPATELVTASAREHGAIRFLVQANVPEVDILYRDWLQRKRFRFRSLQGGAKGFLEIEPSRALRAHPFWWDPGASLAVRSMRLRAETPDGDPARVEVRYAGPYRFAARFYRGELESLRVPGRAEAGRERRLPIRLRNAGGRYWATDDPIPVFLSYRVFALPRGDEGPAFVGPLTRLPSRVAPGATLESRVNVVWPPVAGRFEIDIDLVVAGISWFEEWTGAPLARRTIRIVEAADES